MDDQHDLLNRWMPHEDLGSMLPKRFPIDFLEYLFEWPSTKSLTLPGRRQQDSQRLFHGENAPAH
jgi:hypothetical protein